MRENFSAEDFPSRWRMAAEALRKGQGNRSEAIPGRQNGFPRTRPKRVKFGQQLLAGCITKEVPIIKPEVS